MRRSKLFCALAALLTAAACTTPIEDVAPPLSTPANAAKSISAQLAQFDGRVYVYRDYADGWNHFTQRAWMGSHGIKPGDMQQDYQQDVWSGSSSIRCELDFSQLEWGGYMCLNGALGPGETEPVCTYGEADSGVDLSGAAALSFYARGEQGGEAVEFFCGGLGYNEFGATEPFADSTAKVSLGAVTLTKDWARYSIDLSGADMRYIGNGFSWVASKADNPERESIAFLLDEIYFSLPQKTPGMAFLASYFSPSQSENQLVNNFSFLNDNALACIALARSGYVERAAQIADAIVYALENDRAYTDGRLRNGYLCGPVASFPGWYSARGLPYAQIPGFYHQQTGKWHEDYYIVSTDAGSLAWAILALCEIADAVPDGGYTHAAEKIGGFALTLYDQEKGGFVSGYQGWEGQDVRAASLNTQFNFELAAAFGRLAGLTGREAYGEASGNAMRFALSMYSEEKGCFLAGIAESGEAEDIVQLATNTAAALSLPDEHADKRSAALAFVEAEMACGGGYSCSTADNSGVWLDGTAQMAAALGYAGDSDRALRLMDFLEQNRAADGSLYAADRDGLPSGRYSAGDNQPILFYRRLHLGATAWLSLAQTAHNPLRWAGQG